MQATPLRRDGCAMSASLAVPHTALVLGAVCLGSGRRIGGEGPVLASRWRRAHALWLSGLPVRASRGDLAKCVLHICRGRVIIPAVVTLIVIGCFVALIVALLIARAILKPQMHGLRSRRPPGAPGS